MDLSRFFHFRELRDEPKPFLDHLEDLRRTAIKIIFTVIATTVLSFIFQEQIVHLIERPLLAIDPQMKSLVNFGVTDPLTIAIELSFYSGLVIAFPFIIFFIADFILPALTALERRMIYPAAAVSLGLFLFGVVFAYTMVLPSTLKYFFKYSQAMNWAPQWSVREYFSFTTQFIISFGLAFELPLGVLLLVKLGVVEVSLLRRTRSFAIMIIFFLAAIIMPSADIFTMCLLGGPMYVLYELCILIATFAERKTKSQVIELEDTDKRG